MGWCLKFNDMPYRAGSRNANLNKSTFPVSDCLADDPRETRERPAKKQGGGGGRENLNNRTVLGKGEGV